MSNKTKVEVRVVATQTPDEPEAPFPRLMKFVGTTRYRNGEGLWVALFTSATEAGITLFDRIPTDGVEEKLGERTGGLPSSRDWEPFTGTLQITGL